MDHFARPDDELAVAQLEGVLHRNFQGYTTRRYRSAGDGGFCYQHDWRWLHAEPEELKRYYQQVDRRGNALCGVVLRGT